MPLIGDGHVYLSTACSKHMNEFLIKANGSRTFHDPWVSPPLNQKEYSSYLNRISEDNQAGYFIHLNKTHEIAGVINLNEIVRGAFQSAYLGYYCFEGYEKKGLMTEGMLLAVNYAFSTLKLHRLEANIQPENAESIALVLRCGFVKEGYSKAYLNINGEWKDHVRYALTVEDFNSNDS